MEKMTMEAMTKLVRIASSFDKAYENLVLLCQEIRSDSLYKEAKACFDEFDVIMAKIAGAAFNHDRFMNG